MPKDTGFPQTDAQFDFSRARRRRGLARLANRLKGRSGAKVAILPFEEVVEALGRRGERRLGLKSIPLDSIVGTVDRGFRPTSSRPRGRFERIATAKRRGESMPPIRVYRIANAHFVEDGHHRVAVARAQSQPDIDAYVTEVVPEIGHDLDLRKATPAELRALR